MRRKQPSNMFTIMRLLVAPPARYDDGLYRVRPRYIVIHKGNPSWKDQPPENNDTNPYWYQYDWPIITKDCLKRLLKKGWLKEIEPGAKIWTASEQGKEEYRSIGPHYARFIRARPALSKYRRMKLKAAKRAALYEERWNKPEPEPQPVRKVRKSVKFRHDGYRRQCHKHWLQDEINCTKENANVVS